MSLSSSNSTNNSHFFSTIPYFNNLSSLYSKSPLSSIVSSIASSILAEIRDIDKIRSAIYKTYYPFVKDTLISIKAPIQRITFRIAVVTGLVFLTYVQVRMRLHHILLMGIGFGFVFPEKAKDTTRKVRNLGHLFLNLSIPKRIFYGAGITLAAVVVLPHTIIAATLFETTVFGYLLYQAVQLGRKLDFISKKNIPLIEK